MKIILSILVIALINLIGGQADQDLPGFDFTWVLEDLCEPPTSFKLRYQIPDVEYVIASGAKTINIDVFDILPDVCGYIYDVEIERLPGGQVPIMDKKLSQVDAGPLSVESSDYSLAG